MQSKCNSFRHRTTNLTIKILFSQPKFSPEARKKYIGYAGKDTAGRQLYITASMATTAPTVLENMPFRGRPSDVKRSPSGRGVAPGEKQASDPSGRDRWEQP